MDETKIRVIYADTDQMGVVYHANYLRYFEAARGEYFRARGRSYRDFEREGFMLPVVGLCCTYRSPARYEDVLVVRTRVKELRRASLTFAYELVREDEPGRILVTATTTHACVTTDGHRPVRWPADVEKLLSSSEAPDTAAPESDVT